MEKPFTRPPLPMVVEIAHEHDVPVIVDAAAELPPTENLSKYTEQGADLVAFSGGKAIRSPQSSGILAGREDLIKSVARQHLDMHAAEAAYEPPEDLVAVDELSGVPRQGFGRSMKVGKEELAGLIAALDAFIEQDDAAVLARWHERAERIADGLESVDGLEAELANAGKTDTVTSVVATVTESAPIEATDIVSGLRQENPRVFVGADDLHLSQFTVNPRCLPDEQIDYVVDRTAANVDPA